MRTRWGVFAVLLAVSPSCGSDPQPDDPEDADRQDETPCPSDTPEFNLGPMGLTAAPNEDVGVRAYLDHASARPPRNGSNDLTIQLTDLDGNPLPEAILTWACAYMPVHKHGSNPRMVHALGDGKFMLERQNMAMEGGWLIQLWVDPAGGGEPFEGGRGAIGSEACVGPTPEPTLEMKVCVPG